MREFASIDTFLKFASTLPEATRKAAEEGTKKGAEIIQKEAKDEIGHYQGAVEGHEAWAELADSTKDDRVAKGFPANNPLLRSGELRDSIQMRASGLEATVGSDNPIAIWQELGTHRQNGMAGDLTGSIPPRTFLAGAAIRKTDWVVDAISSRFVWVLRGLPAQRND